MQAVAGGEAVTSEHAPFSDLSPFFRKTPVERLPAFALRVALSAAIVVFVAAGCGRREIVDRSPPPTAAPSDSAESGGATKTPETEENSDSILPSQPPAKNDTKPGGEPAGAAAPVGENPPSEALAAEGPAIKAWERLGARVERNDEGLVYRLEATGLKITASEARHLADLRALESLEIGETLLDDATLHCISGLVGLKRLYLREAGLTDDALENLKGLQHLEVLSLAGNQIRGMGLAHLRGLEKLEVLNLSKNPLTDDGLAHLANLKELNTLTLADTRVTGAGLVHLKPLAKIRVLNLDRTQVVDGDLSRLTGFQNMRMLYLRGCKVTEESVSKLDGAISGLSIYP